MLDYPAIKSFDNEVYQSIIKEYKRQQEHIELIASENYTYLEVLEAQSSILTNKYAEGYPTKRYYGGCEFVDEIELLAIKRAKKLFNADYVNVQPHSGSQANQEVFAALIKPGDTVLGMSLSSGGHLTHGSNVNFSGKIYQAIGYGINDKGVIDYNQIENLAKTHKPKLIISGFSAYSGIVDWQKFRGIADKVGAYLMADIAHVAGLIAANLYPSPVQIADVTTTTTHKTLRGARGGMIMAKANPEIEKKLNSSVFPGNQGGPLMHAIAAKAIAFKYALSDEFKQYQKQVLLNAKIMAETLMDRNYEIVSNGTQNHMFLVSLVKQNLTGKQADLALSKASITVNKNSIPNDPQSPFITSGIRIGSPAITSRGFKETEAKKVANLVADVLDNIDNDAKLEQIKQKVIQLTSNFPIY